MRHSMYIWRHAEYAVCGSLFAMVDRQTTSSHHSATFFFTNFLINSVLPSAAPRCFWPLNVMFTPLLPKMLVAWSRWSSLTISQVLAGFGWYPNDGPNLLSSIDHHSCRFARESPAAASLANQTCLLAFSFRTRGSMPKVYMAIASGSP